MSDELSPAKVRLTDGLGPLPEPMGDYPEPGERTYSEGALLAFGRQERAAERERCAVAAWTHYMDTCRKLGRAPSMWNEWCAADVIRGA